MRASVYRNLDKPFQIFGLSVFELTLLCLVLVLGGELVEAFSVSRVWIFPITILLGCGIFWIRYSLGEAFAQRLFRFLQLPGRVRPKLIRTKGRP